MTGKGFLMDLVAIFIAVIAADVALRYMERGGLIPPAVAG